MVASQQTKTKESVNSAIVIGAGIVGVCSAWHLQRRGYSVVVIDRELPGNATSWGNAGLIKRLPPSPFPRRLAKRASIVANSRNDTRYTVSGMMEYYYPLFLYWWYSRPSIFSRIVKEYATLAEHCTQEHNIMAKAAKCEHLLQRTGFFEMFRSKPMQLIRESVMGQQNEGQAVELVTPEELTRREPSANASLFTGGYFFTDAWLATDPGELVKAYANHFVSVGGTIIRATVKSITPRSDGSGSGYIVTTNNGSFEAPLVVVAAGPWSNEVLRPLGYQFPLYALRGYNTHFRLAGDAQLHHTIVDVDYGYTLGPMHQGIRINTGGEMASITSPQNEIQLKAAESAARQLIPLEGPISKTWAGYRPCTSDMKPIIGESPHHPGLWMCFGHGSNGLTLGPVSGRLLAELIAGETPFIDARPFSATRF
ncbi:D-amino-acid dehydrogenase [Leptomonas pyrrhocoris]|uniref:D-amino-acid dehydrogenase n=1 Tax=Leptomonas pyrrhocoris TaxID=157538 RepID=A0A0M9FPG0_LEPPY|nr:D-amino-acid dehydrogenase [Leptomonas pyrrhocoris]KPA73239.1 D-amino-acid dehydrogenase [Leptomonas pyrrhocoris]|eukprot:XP_015651678.1 D-amino-acid dehydrogenase [Leptomonas pyrrhocoris]